jgi:sigma-E factor negative regulatory protein RseB
MQVRVGSGSAAARVQAWRWCWLLLAAVAGGALAQSAHEGSAPRPARTDLQWLQSIQSAAQRVNFVGTVVYQQGGSMRSSRIVHVWDGNSSHERLQMLDGKPREFIRKDLEVQCLFPEARRLLIERRLPGESFPSLGGGAPREILDSYSLKIGPLERVAGMDCQVILLEPRDSLRFAHRLCVEPASSLLLRAQTLDARQQPIDQMAFTDVRINERIDRALLRPSWSTEGWRVERSEHRPTDLARLGWNINPPAGFRLVRQVERRPAEGEHRMYQAVLSDGIATLSVFIDFNGGTQTGPDLVHTHGALSGYSRRVGDALVTVVGEVPAATTQAVANGVTNTSVPAAPAAVPSPEGRISR